MMHIDDSYTTHKKKNKVKQSIEQSQSSNQIGPRISGVSTVLSCNNLSLQGKIYSGNHYRGAISSFEPSRGFPFVSLISAIK